MAVALLRSISSFVSRIYLWLVPTAVMAPLEVVTIRQIMREMQISKIPNTSERGKGGTKRVLSCQWVVGDIQPRFDLNRRASFVPSHYQQSWPLALSTDPIPC